MISTVLARFELCMVGGRGRLNFSYVSLTAAKDVSVFWWLLTFKFWMVFCDECYSINTCCKVICWVNLLRGGIFFKEIFYIHMRFGIEVTFEWNCSCNRIL